MNASVSEIKCVKSIVDLLNEYYPPFVYENKYTGQSILLQHNFTSHFDEGIWFVCCSHYWTYVDEDFQSLKENLLLIAQEEDVDIKFISVYHMTQVIRRKSNIQNGSIFLGRADSKVLS
jgi:hypothetical protein